MSILRGDVLARLQVVAFNRQLERLGFDDLCPDLHRVREAGREVGINLLPFVRGCVVDAYRRSRLERLHPL